jgi:N-acetylglucosaminyl-diphospho-decaprenol L-rhamnosyltransferase
MDVSVVIVTYDSRACIAECLRAVRSNLGDAELVVVDNASTDSTKDLIAGAAPEAHVVANRENVGFGRACNAGAAVATRGHLLFLNPDVVVTNVDADELARVLAAEPFGLVAPLLDAGGGLQAERHWLADYVDHTWQTVTPRGLRTGLRGARDGDTPWASGAMLLVDRTEFLALGGFDDRFFLYYEDRDLSARYRDAGLPLRTTSAICGSHAGGSSSELDDLRASSLAWSFLGWLQYLYLHGDERAASRRARIGLATLRTLSAALSAAHRLRPRQQRIAVKQRQLRELLALLEQQSRNGSAPDGKPFYPDARRILARVG